MNSVDNQSKIICNQKNWKSVVKEGKKGERKKKKKEER